MPEPILMSDPRVTTIPVTDCGEPLTDVRAALRTTSREDDGTGAFAHLREGVLTRLTAAEQHLPAGLRLLFIEGYRPPALQRRYFENYSATLRAAHPDWTPEAVHVAATPEDSDGACYTHAANIGAEARANRRLLIDALGAVGLVNYPTEWWHWSYGDRYWAMVTGAACALYGPVGGVAGGTVPLR
ncbi:dipeptidase [Streptomyces roseirectus]|uniref:Dipeptidase n=1 Tax=Streptomyces roseirectus TaxID=2768066 RepID=A0A7H0I6L3_9ACTN|nr:M15 family metallopeptidase [Streptomyces roseirectus]QNP68429.1 dipeptidase [Streptomyces roseirectus]